jgi:small nuclear ribonucleoprotein (snRNP)-like protein
MAKYDYQMNLILEHIFEKKESGSKKNPVIGFAK